MTGIGESAHGAGDPGGLVLVLNSGSSSVKFAVLAPASGERVLAGMAERVGTPEAELRIRRYPDHVVAEQLPEGSYHAAISRILDHLPEAGLGTAEDGAPAPGQARLVGAGHRVVHGGERFTASVLVDDEVIAAIRSSSHLARCTTRRTWLASRRSAPRSPTWRRSPCLTPRSTRPCRPAPSATRCPKSGTPGTRSAGTGSHGTSYRFVSERAAALLGRPLTELRLVIAHLGNGCSVTAVRDGVSVDTTMGLTPMEGLVMGTRSGDVDPGVFGYLADRAGLTIAGLDEALNTASGLQGLSGVGNDMRTVEAAAAKGSERARLALEVFVHRLAKAIAGMVVGLERIDALVFTAGIGENSAFVRSQVLARLGFLGLAEEAGANARHGRDTRGRISLDGPVVAMVVPTDEELMIARDTARLAAVGARPL